MARDRFIQWPSTYATKLVRQSGYGGDPGDLSTSLGILTVATVVPFEKSSSYLAGPIVELNNGTTATQRLEFWAYQQNSTTDILKNFKLQYFLASSASRQTASYWYDATTSPGRGSLPADWKRPIRPLLDRPITVAGWWRWNGTGGSETGNGDHVLFVGDDFCPITLCGDHAESDNANTVITGSVARLNIGGDIDGRRFWGRIWDVAIVQTASLDTDAVVAFLRRVQSGEFEDIPWTSDPLGTGDSVTYGAWYLDATDAAGDPLSSIGDTDYAAKDYGSNGHDLYGFVGSGWTAPVIVTDGDVTAPSWTDALDVTSPPAHAVLQRDDVSSLSSGDATVTVTGRIRRTIAGTTPRLQAQLGGTTGTWATVSWTSGDGDTAGDEFSVSLTGTPGMDIRFREGDSGSEVTCGTWPVHVGDLLFVVGQSNAHGTDVSGTADGYMRPVDVGGLRGVSVFHVQEDSSSGQHVWKPLSEPAQGIGGQQTASPDYSAASWQGSCWSRMAGYLTEETGVPLGLILCARGGTPIDRFRKNRTTGGADDGTWNTSASGSTQPNTVFEELIQRAQQIVGDSNGTSPDYLSDEDGSGALHDAFRGVLWWQGESDADINTGSTYATHLAEIEEDLRLAFQAGSPTIPWRMLVATIGNYAAATVESPDYFDPIRKAQSDLWGTQSARRGPDIYDISISADTDLVHVNATDGSLTEAAKRWAAAVYAELYATTPADYRGPSISTAVIGTDQVVITFDMPIDDDSAYYKGLRVTLNATLQTHVNDTPNDPNEIRITRTASNQATIEFASATGLDSGDTVLISSGRGRDGYPWATYPVPRATVTIGPTTVALPLRYTEDFEATVGAVDLDIHDATHVHTAESPGLTQTHELDIDDAIHVHTSENVALTQTHQLAVDDSTHTHSAESLALTQAHQLAVDDATHLHTAESPTLTQVHVLAVDDATHTHSAESPALTQDHVLTIQNTDHAHTAENVVLSVGAITLEIDDTIHVHTSENVALTQTHQLAVDDSTHVHTADEVTLTGGATLDIQDATHVHTAENVALTQVHALAVDDSSHAHTAEGVTLTQVHVLDIDDSTHAHAADEVTLVVAGITLVIDDSTHVHTAESPGLTQTHELDIDDAVHAHTADVVLFAALVAAYAGRPTILSRSAGKPTIVTGA